MLWGSSSDGEVQSRLLFRVERSAILFWGLLRCVGQPLRWPPCLDDVLARHRVFLINIRSHPTGNPQARPRRSSGHLRSRASMAFGEHAGLICHSGLRSELARLCEESGARRGRHSSSCCLPLPIGRCNCFSVSAPAQPYSRAATSRQFHGDVLAKTSQTQQGLRDAFRLTNPPPLLFPSSCYRFLAPTRYRTYLSPIN